ncbi:polysaccharide deacetylase family protein [Catenovulum sp. SM1970]|uniref:polysaccharide deacetylase family protein n=1 Tax=Marinifaba aquimaris TaxID=2741323 RepID=UPI001572F9E6|nr:polysaccharide deacetylase family protein [Marinifaba aquimaris]NTS75610.1 polysaccharide deacetylase family protein [Marinifaba aquimaris]
MSKPVKSLLVPSLLLMLSACGGNGGSGPSQTFTNSNQQTTETQTDTAIDERIIGDVTYLATELANEGDEAPAGTRLFYRESSSFSSQFQSDRANQVSEIISDIAGQINIKDIEIFLESNDFATDVLPSNSTNTLFLHLTEADFSDATFAFELSKAIYKAHRHTFIQTDTQAEQMISDGLASAFAIALLNTNTPNDLLPQAGSDLNTVSNTIDLTSNEPLPDDDFVPQIGYQAALIYMFDYPGSDPANLVSMPTSAFESYLALPLNHPLQEKKTTEELLLRTGNFPDQQSVEFITQQGRDNPGTYFLEGYNKRKMIALTFDDGPNNNYTVQILDILLEHDIKATFFWTGQNLNTNRAVALRAMEEGHVISNHTWDHPHSPTLTADDLWQDQIERTNDLFEEYLGFKSRLFRPPYGEITQEQVNYLNDRGMKTIAWSVDTRDWYTRNFYPGYPATTVEDIEQTVISLEHEEMIVLMHDGGAIRQNTVDSLENIIEHYHSQGYEFVTIETLLGIGNKY